MNKLNIFIISFISLILLVTLSSAVSFNNEKLPTVSTDLSSIGSGSTTNNYYINGTSLNQTYCFANGTNISGVDCMRGVWKINTTDFDSIGNKILTYASQIVTASNENPYGLVSSGPNIITTALGRGVLAFYETNSDVDDWGMIMSNRGNGTLLIDVNDYYDLFGIIPTLILGNKLDGDIMDLNVTGNINADYNITANKFIGDGSLLTGISGGSMNYTNIFMLNQSNNVSKPTQFNNNVSIGTKNTSRGILDINNAVIIGTPTGASASIVYDEGNYWNDGYSYQYRVYAYKTVGSSRVYSSSYSQSTLVTDDGGSSIAEDVQITWNAVSGADGYRILIYNEAFGANWDYYYDTTSTNFIDGDGTESSFVSGNTVTPISLGADFYINNVGTLLQNGQINAQNINLTSSNPSTISGPILHNTTGYLGTAGQKWSYVGLNPTPYEIYRYRMEGGYGTSFQFSAFNGGTNAKSNQWVCDYMNRCYVSFLNDAESVENYVFAWYRSGYTFDKFNIAGKTNIGYSIGTTPKDMLDINGGISSIRLNTTLGNITRLNSSDIITTNLTIIGNRISNGTASFTLQELNATGSSSSSPITTYSIGSLDVNNTSNTAWKQMVFAPLTANNNYTVDCYFDVYSNITTTGVQLNVSLNQTPKYLTFGYSHPTTATADAFTRCNGILRECVDLSGTSVVAGLPVWASGRIVVNQTTNTYLNISMRSEINNGFASVRAESYCKVTNGA